MSVYGDNRNSIIDFLRSIPDEYDKNCVTKLQVDSVWFAPRGLSTYNVGRYSEYYRLIGVRGVELEFERLRIKATGYTGYTFGDDDLYYLTPDLSTKRGKKVITRVHCYNNIVYVGEGYSRFILYLYNPRNQYVGILDDIDLLKNTSAELHINDIFYEYHSFGFSKYYDFYKVIGEDKSNYVLQPIRYRVLDEEDNFYNRKTLVVPDINNVPVDWVSLRFKIRKTSVGIIDGVVTFRIAHGERWFHKWDGKPKLIVSDKGD